MEIPEPLRETVQAWYDAFDEADAGRLASLYSEDGMIFLPSGQTLRGRDAIAKHYGAMLPQKERDKPRLGPRKLFFLPADCPCDCNGDGKARREAFAG